MAGKTVVNTVQLGDSTTATQNFVLKSFNDGTCKLSRGNDGATTQDILSVNSAGVVTLNQGVAGLISTSDTVCLGYGTGAGGNIVQATSKSTAVTLNKPTGQIAMNTASLASNTTVSFTMNNSLITASDILITSFVGGLSYGNYIITTQCLAGSANIFLRNISASPLSEQVTFNFAIIKGATA